MREALAREPPVREVVWEKVADKNGNYLCIFLQRIDLCRFLSSSVRNSN